MNSVKHAKKQLSVGNIMYWSVGALLLLVLLTTCLVSGLFAKYVISEEFYDSARVASTGIGKLELVEHKANDKKTANDKPTGEYELDMQDDDGVKRNTYTKVLPGTDIPKDPVVRIELNELTVSYTLYVKVIESDYFPENVTYKLTENWVKVGTDDGADIYQYNSVDPVTNEKTPFIFKAGMEYEYEEIHILKDDTLYVGEFYVGEGKSFTLSFDAWLKQVNE